MASSSSLFPPKVPMELHAKNREKLLKSLRQHLTETSRPLHGFVFLQVSIYLSMHVCIVDWMMISIIVIIFYFMNEFNREARKKLATALITSNSSGNFFALVSCNGGDLLRVSILLETKCIFWCVGRRVISLICLE